MVREGKDKLVYCWSKKLHTYLDQVISGPIN